VFYDIPPTPDAAVRLGSLHSHGALDAHHSAADWDDDVASPGVHIVIGLVDCPIPSICCYASDGSRCYPVPFGDVFEQAEWPKAPDEWFVEAPKPERRSYGQS
jgi:hypothetical protein